MWDKSLEKFSPEEYRNHVYAKNNMHFVLGVNPG